MSHFHTIRRRSAALLGAALLIGVSLLIGLYPRLLLDAIVPSFNSPLFEWVKKGGQP